MHDDGERPKRIVVLDLMQQDYEYYLIAPAGEVFDTRFKPELTPEDMLQLGVFRGKYLADCRDEFPDEWYAHARLCDDEHAAELNYFGVNASLPLSEWRRRGWIHPADPRGWFQWYCRYLDGQARAGRGRAADRSVAVIQAPRGPGAAQLPAGCRRVSTQAAPSAHELGV